MWSPWCPSTQVVSAGGTRRQSGLNWKSIVSEMLKWTERLRKGRCGNRRSVYGPVRPSLGTRVWGPGVSRLRLRTLNRFGVKGRSSSIAEVLMVDTPGVVRQASNPSEWRTMGARRKWSSPRLQLMPRGPSNQMGQVRRIVIDEDERSQAREVVRVKDPLAAVRDRGHLALVETDLAEAVVLDQEVAEDPADLEATGDARVVVTMTVLRNSCSL